MAKKGTDIILGGNTEFMTKTEILKFCANDIYPIHNGMKRTNQDVAYYLRGNRKFTNLNHQLFYSRQRGINCIPMHIYKKFLSVDLVGIEKGIINFKTKRSRC